ncbi:MAG: hypothetical protein HeimC3_43970 [Candidatus Heimdallarchaeota archaeon LC_3]|nr:MAG: hypothetical protein HeimC3_43970 [Candidatus Heimdallarchaeota archaeon LC_3]
MDMQINNTIGQEFLKISIERFHKLKDLAERAISQVKDDKKLYWLPDGESNSIAIIARHIAGNQRSRWTDFLTADGEKSNRNRPLEFEREFKPSRNELLNIWNIGWQTMFNTLNSLTPKDLLKEVRIRKEPHSVLEAILRQLTHYSEHVGQIMFLAKHIEWENWEHLSMPRDKVSFDYKGETHF